MGRGSGRSRERKREKGVFFFRMNERIEKHFRFFIVSASPLVLGHWREANGQEESASTFAESLD